MATLAFLKKHPMRGSRLHATLDEQTALEVAVGPDFMAVGKLERALLRSFGLRHDDLVVDVGCGSGRLALQLSTGMHQRYLGTDVVPEFLNNARRLCGRADWDFLCTSGSLIPCADDCADFVCFFSVFTHLTHAHSYRYLGEAKRVLKPGGRVVFSFLQPRSGLAANALRFNPRTTSDPGHPFIEREQIAFWARSLGLHLDSIADGDEPHIPLEEDIAWNDGRIMQGHGNLGQSITVLSKPVVNDPTT